MVYKKGWGRHRTSHPKWFSQKKEWGTGSFHCAVLALDEVKPHFISVVIEEAIYENLMKQWRGLLDQHPNPSPPQAKEKSPPVLRSQKSAQVQLFEPEATMTSVTQFSTASTQEVPLPNRLLALLEIHHLPWPTYPFPDTIQTLICWTDPLQKPFAIAASISHVARRRRYGSKQQRFGNAVAKLASNRQSFPSTPAPRLCRRRTGGHSIIIQSLCSKMVCSHTLRASLAALEKALAQGKARTDPQRDASLIEMRKATRVRGLRAADIWVDRLFSVFSASITNTIAFGGAETTGPKPDGADHHTVLCTFQVEMICLNRKSHLFGKIF